MIRRDLRKRFVRQTFGEPCCLSGFRPTQPITSRQARDLLCAGVAHQLAVDVLASMVPGEAAFFLNAFRLLVPVEPPAPNLVQFQVLETMANELSSRLWYQPLAPERDADLVADFRFGARDFLVGPRTDHQPYASDGPAVFLQADGVRLRRGKHGTDDFRAVVNARVRWPAGNRPHPVVLRVPIQILCVRFSPWAEYQPLCCQLHIFLHRLIWIDIDSSIVFAAIKPDPGAANVFPHEGAYTTSLIDRLHCSRLIPPRTIL